MIIPKIKVILSFSAVIASVLDSNRHTRLMDGCRHDKVKMTREIVQQKLEKHTGSCLNMLRQWVAQTVVGL